MNMKPNVFEVMWDLLMKEFNLEDTRWFKDMLTKCDSWIPGYFFNDIPLCGLMKTTSRSESMNYFFNTYSESENLLLNFKMNYNTTIQNQMNTQRELDKETKKASYKMETPREIELQASKVYTNGWEVYSVQHNSKHEFKNEFMVKIKVEEKEINYNCEYFIEEKKKLDLFVEKQKILLKGTDSDYTSVGLKSKTDGEVVCKLMSVSVPIPEEINIHVRQVQNNKGSKIKKRIPSAGEIAYVNSKKEHKMCLGCGEQVSHNLRTCSVTIAIAQSTQDI
ncbi:uncharacterized protein LOC111915270 [Lactuca sativa]|uniref:uncharacterized protein LOC111915270 n=1 Tax=Lactuca sativa TaxID=4236 RepID=UPI000CD82EB0|nr:uncharacterized protein LOC111915270 [Lactuca sativa]